MHVLYILELTRCPQLIIILKYIYTKKNRVKSKRQGKTQKRNNTIRVKNSQFIIEKKKNKKRVIISVVFGCILTYQFLAGFFLIVNISVFDTRLHTYKKRSTSR